MGLLKETMQAIIRIDRNLEQLKIQYAIDNDHCGKALNRLDHRVRPIEQVRSESREKTSKTFAYTEIKSIGGRICAIREYLGLLQSQLAERLAVNSSYISKLERGTSMPSETLIRLLSLIANIDETWLATGHLPQTTEEPTKPLATCKVTPLSGYGYGNGGFQLSFHESEKLRNDYMDSMVKGIDYGDPNGSVTNVTPLSGYGGLEDLQKHLNLQHQTRLEVERQMADQKDPQ